MREEIGNTGQSKSSICRIGGVRTAAGAGTGLEVEALENSQTAEVALGRPWSVRELDLCNIDAFRPEGLARLVPSFW